MTDTALLIWGLLALVATAAVPLTVYALLPHEELNLVSMHGRFGWVTARERTQRPSGNSPAPSLGSLQHQTA